MTTLDLAALAAYGGVSGPRVAVAGTGVLALPGLIPDKGLSSPGAQSKPKSAGLAGLDSEAVRRWVAEATRTVRQVPPSLVVPASSPQQQQQQHHRQPQHHHQQQHHHSAHRQRQEPSPPSVGISSFVLPASMTQTPSMHLLENNNLVEVAIAQQQQSQQQSQLTQQQLTQKQKQTSPTNNNTIEVWRSIQGGHQWWSPPASVHQEQQQQPSIVQVSQSPSLVAGSVCGQMQRHHPQVQSEIDQPLDFSVGSLQQQRLHSRVRTMHERHQGRMHDNNNGTASSQKIIRGDVSRRSYSPSEASISSSEDEGVSTGGSPSGPLRGASGECQSNPRTIR